MPVEIEVKFRLADPAGLRARLERIATPEGPVVFEVNRLFDDAARTLRDTGCGLRIREAHVGALVTGILTYKGPRQPGPLKVREELETTVGDPDTVARILGRLGYTQRIVYEKRRETWQVRDCEVVLDEVPQLGWFAEIEGPTAAAVEGLAQELGLTDADSIPESYVELTDRNGNETTDGGRELRF